MKKIIVAGAGHGGITAAFNFAKNGYDVTVYEMKKREELGYDWHDCICKRIFKDSGFESPDESTILPFLDMSYYNPSKDVRIDIAKSKSTAIGYIDRQFLYDFIIAQAEAAGVKFVYGAKITRALTASGAVTGIEYLLDGKKCRAEGELTVDAAGVDSPVRQSLPKEFGVLNYFDESDIFCTYRAYFENTAGSTVKENNDVYFFHCGKPGMDWFITEPGFTDVLVGGFGSLTREDVDRSLADFKERYPYMGEKIRGGSFARIPLRKVPSKIICNGYAAVGDSASMTESLSGSGISWSFDAGKWLADTVIALGEKPCTEENLWAYQYKYFKTNCFGNLQNYVLKCALSGFNAKQIDALMKDKVLTAKELAGGKYTKDDIIEKAKAFIKHPDIILPFAKAGLKIAGLAKIKASVPEKYDKKAVSDWCADYEAL